MSITLTAPDGSTFVERAPKGYTHASIYMGDFGWRTRAWGCCPESLEEDMQLMFRVNPNMTDQRYSIVEVTA